MSGELSPQEEILSYEGHVYPGFDGIPFRSKSSIPPDLKADDAVLPVVVVDAKVKVFDLTNEEQLSHYEFIWDQVAKGRFVQPVEERQYDPELKGWRVFIRFGVRWLEMPRR